LRIVQVGNNADDVKETIDLVKKGFPDLAGVEAERFDFEVYNIRQSWVRVMDEAWELLNRDPPLVWVIKIKDTPEERAQRTSTPFFTFMTYFVDVMVN
jgi:hypothetical protein